MNKEFEEFNLDASKSSLDLDLSFTNKEEENTKNSQTHKSFSLLSGVYDNLTNDQSLTQINSENVYLKNIYGLFVSLSKKIDQIGDNDFIEQVYNLLKTNKFEEATKMIEYKKVIKNKDIKNFYENKDLEEKVLESEKILKEIVLEFDVYKSKIKDEFLNLEYEKLKLKKAGEKFKSFIGKINIENIQEAEFLKVFPSNYKKLIQKETKDEQIEILSKKIIALGNENGDLQEMHKNAIESFQKMKRELVIYKNEAFKAMEASKRKSAIIEKQKNIIEILQTKISADFRNDSPIIELSNKVDILRGKIKIEKDEVLRIALKGELKDCEKRLDDFLKFCRNK